MVRFLPFLLSLALTVYALFSCIQTRDEDVPHLPKLIWIALIVLVPFVGPLTWLLMSRNPGTGAKQPAAGPKPSNRPVAPDDDPDFLATLERYRDPRTTTRPDRKPADPADSSKAEPAQNSQDKTSQGKSGPGNPSRNELDKTKPDKTKPDKTKPGKSGEGKGGSAAGGPGTEVPEAENAPDSPTDADGDGSRKP